MQDQLAEKLYVMQTRQHEVRTQMQQQQADLANRMQGLLQQAHWQPEQQAW